MAKLPNLSAIEYLEHDFLNAKESMEAFSSLPILLLHQVHKNDVVLVDFDDMGKSIDADGSITTSENLYLGIKTADCVPVLLADREKPIIAAVHAGWRSAFANIIPKAVELMCQKGANRENIVAGIGPAIAKASYEVGLDFYDNFTEKNRSYNEFFSADAKFFDLPAFVKSSLLNAGVSNVEKVAVDTFTDENYFSYRRNNAEVNRNLSIIKIKKGSYLKEPFIMKGKFPN